MSRRTPSTSLENAKKEAKRWFKAFQAGDADARTRLEQWNPDAPAVPSLRHIQYALARERGFSGWRELKIALEQQQTSPSGHDGALVSRFLDSACPDHHVRGGPDHVRARHTALRLLERYPEIAQASFATAVVCGDLARVRRMLADEPALATRREPLPNAAREDGGSNDDLVRRDLGPKGWDPLLYLCFTRLPLPTVDENAVAIARSLLDHGADPNTFFKAGGSSYTPLVGAVGEGEEDRPAHQRRDELVKLLLERGAEPYDIQVVYNIAFHGHVLWWLQAMYDRSVFLGRQADWDDPEWSMLNMGGYGSGARWHLDIAVKRNDAVLAEWCLSHGANPNSPPARDTRFLQRTLYEDAIILGHTEVADVLLRYGARPAVVTVEPMDAFVAACLRLDREELTRTLAAHPEFMHAAKPLLEAARRNRTDVARFLLDLGMSPNVENTEKERPLHYAGYHDAVDVARLLIERGADIDPVESNWSNTPLGAATYAQNQRMIDLLAPLSRDVWELTMNGKVERLREVLREKPERARVSWNGHTPLMWLPAHDETLALETVRLFLDHGADPTLRNNDGMTAADRAERLGMFEVASELRRAGG
jgi:uncharacterized protein